MKNPQGNYRFGDLISFDKAAITMRKDQLRVDNYRNLHVTEN